MEDLIGLVLNPILMFLAAWWWLILPLLLYPLVKFFYLWWIQWEVWYKNLEWMLVEVTPPSEIAKPFRAMQDIFAALWGPVYDAANWREQWCEGELAKGPQWFSFEVVSVGGEIHFYLRILKGWRKLIEATIHTHYPEAEIIEAEDYVKKIPHDLPNENYDLLGEDYRFIKDDAYPIKTYKFFEIRPEEIEAEKKLDPFYSLLEALAKLKEGEQFWFQVIMTPVTNSDLPWVDRAKEIVAELVKRPKKSEPPSIVGETFRTLSGEHLPYQQEKEEKPIIPPEMRMTPGEREIVEEIETKISQLAFKTSIRGLYIFKRDVFSPGNVRIARAYFSHFATQNLNTIVQSNKTRTKIHYWFRKRRLLARKKSIFRKYLKRFPPTYPKREGVGVMVLTPEELATLIHFPMKASILPSGIPRIPSKKGGPPPVLPQE